FPSGHTLHAVAFSMVAISFYPALAWLLVPFTLLVASSRVVLGLHYPSDVLAGAALGAIIALASLAF
ncbi:MAG TPA: phosphatase PAP2 family protein, partial [Burkholderiales bacterium]|nr:phosphatase PAP2 family protein [Burkholderiales bacterium]